MSFAFLFLIQNPPAYKAAQKEVDDVLGKTKIETHHLKKLKYLNAVLRETLRLCPTAPGISKQVNPISGNEMETIGKGKYPVQKGTRLAIMLSKTMRDVRVYGEDADEFKPERMLDEEFEKRPTAAWKVNQRRTIWDVD